LAHDVLAPIVSALNYAYTVGLAQLQIGAIADGYDPTIGIMHHEGRNKPAYALDLIEPERPRWTPYCCGSFNPGHFPGLISSSDRMVSVGCLHNWQRP